MTEGNEKETVLWNLNFRANIFMKSKIRNLMLHKWISFTLMIVPEKFFTSCRTLLVSGRSVQAFFTLTVAVMTMEIDQ